MVIAGLHDWCRVMHSKERGKVRVEKVSEAKDELPFLMQCELIQFKSLIELQWDGDAHLERV